MQASLVKFVQGPRYIITRSKQYIKMLEFWVSNCFVQIHLTFDFFHAILQGDVEYFQQYLDRLLGQYSNAVDLEFNHLEEGYVHASYVIPSL